MSRQTANQQRQQRPQHHPSQGRTWPLHYACRKGDLDQVRYLVEVLRHKVNEADDFDATPLYLAAYCGYTDICQYLLERGARCDEEGEAARVFYVALTPELRQLLRDWSLSAASRDPFTDLLLSLTKDPSAKNNSSGSSNRTNYHHRHQNHRYADCYWETTDSTHHLHKVVLHAVCPRLLDYLDEHDRLTLAGPLGGDDVCYRRCDDDDDDDDDNEIAVLVPRLVEYLYSGRCEVRGSSDRLSRFASLARTLDLEPLRQALHRTLASPSGGDRRGARGGAAATVLSCNVQHRLVHERLGLLARRITSRADGRARDVVPYSDLTLTWGDTRQWHVHTGLLCPQSDFFAGAIRGDFGEARQAAIDLTHWAPCELVVDLAVQWMYCDSFLGWAPSDISVDVAVAVVEFGAGILCPRLCHYAAQVCLVPAVTSDNVWQLLDLSRFHQLERLEDACVAAVAASLPELANSAELRRALRDEIRDTAQKGDVRFLDVPLAADIRRHLLRGLSSDDDYQASLDMLNMALASAIAEEQHLSSPVQVTPSSH